MKSLAVICVRALGAFLIALNVNTLGVFAVPMVGIGGSFDGRVWMALAGPLGFVVVGFLIIMLSKALGGLMVRGVPEAVSPGPDAQQLLKVGTALIGLFFLASVVPDLFDAAWTWLAPALMPETFALDDDARLTRVTFVLVPTAGKAAIGAALLWMAWRKS